MRLRLLTAALGAALFCQLSLAAAAPIEAQGTAPLDAGVTAARELAIQDALHQAALSQGAQVDSAQYMSSGQVSESTSLSAAPISGEIKVLDEHAEGGLYHVKVAITPDQSNNDGDQRDRAHPRPRGCQAPAGRALRRRVVAAYFYVDHPADASDLDALGVRLAREFATRLGAHANEFSARDAGNIGLLPDGHLTEPAWGAAAVRRLAASTNAQFVLAGRVLSTAVTARAPRPTLFGSTLTSQQGVFYNGPFSALLGPGMVYRAVGRQFQLELWVFDGLTGSLLRSQQFAVQSHGNVQPAPAPNFASDAFWQTDYGEDVAGLLDDAVADVTATLSCIPFSARVLRAQGGQLYLDAGGLDGLQVGDKMLVYRQRLSDAVVDPVSGRELGVPETLLGDVSLTQVQPNLSVAVSHGARQAPQAGDLLRFIPKR